jgi:hypothetical protein
MKNLTFKQYLTEGVPVQDDAEDMSPEDMEKRAMEMRRNAQMKRSNPEMAKRKQMMALRKRLQGATDPRLKADLQRRIKELMSGESNETV